MRSITHSFSFFLFTLALATTVGGCSNDSNGTGGASGAGGASGTGGEGGAGGTRSPASLPTYREFGPYAVGVTTLDLPDRQVEVWYPADPASVDGLEPYSYFIRDALSDLIEGLLPPDLSPPFVTDAFLEVEPSADGPFPLVLFAHGASSYRNQSAFLTAHLASWGFVVASADYLERGLGLLLGTPPDPPLSNNEVSRAVVDLIDTETARVGALLEGVVTTESIAITGHSAGGRAAYQFGSEPDVITYIPLSSALFDEEPPELAEKPSLWLTGSTDGIVPVENTVSAYDAAPVPKRLVIIDGMGHLGPSDICTIGESGGGDIALAHEANLPIPDSFNRLGTDGCAEDDVIEEGWPIVRHFVTAQLRWAFGFDEEPVGLSQDVQSEFPEAVFEYGEEL